MRLGIEHARDRIQVPHEVRRQHFHLRSRQGAANLPHRFREMMRAPIGQIVAIHRGNHHVAKIHLRRHIGHMPRLRWIELKFLLCRRTFGH